MSASAPPRGETLARRARAFLVFLATPADATLVARMLAWRICLPVLKYLLPLPRLARLMLANPRSAVRRPDRERRVAAMIAWLYRPGGTLAADDNCLERSLLAYRYLTREGAEPTLVVGVRRPSSQGPEGHVWVTVDGRPVNDTEAALASFAPVVSFAADGTPQREPAES